MSMRRIAYGLLVATLFAVPFEDIYKLPRLGTLARILGLLAFAAWGLAALAAGRMRRPARFHTIGFAFVIWVGLSLFWSLDTPTTLARIETFLQLFALSLVVWDVCDTDREVRAALQAIVFGLWVAAGSVLINFARGVEAYYGRYAASGADPNYQSMTLAMGLAVAWYLSMHTPNRAIRLFNLLYLPVAAVAMGLTGSRGGFLAGFVAVAYIASTLTHLRPAAMAALLITVGAAIGVIATVVPETSFDRITSVGDEIAEGDLNGRAGIWLEAGDVFVDRPIVGVGAGASRAVLPTGKVGHNVAISIALELGVVGLVLFAGLVVAALRAALSIPAPDRRLWLTLLLVWLAGSLSLNLETRKITWILFSLAVLVQHAHERRARAAPVEAPAVSAAMQ